MTRYTKLDGRRSIASGDQPLNGIDEASESETAQVSTSSAVSEDPKALLKRAKLLRLKGKKAKTDEVREKHLHEAKELEKRANIANGARGVLGKRKKEGDTRSKHGQVRFRTLSHD